MKFLSLLSAIGLASVAFLTAQAPTSQTLVLATPGCEPLAPIRVEILSSEVQSGIADILYRVTPLIDAIAIDTAFELPVGAEQLNHDRAFGEMVAREESLTGRAFIRLPQGPVRITLRATLSFEASPTETAGVTEIETASVLRALEWGDVIDTVDLPLVRSGDEMTFDMPATRTGGDGR
jgi:hypothetical protein